MDAKTITAITAKVPTTIPSRASVVNADDLEGVADSATELGDSDGGEVGAMLAELLEPEVDELDPEMTVGEKVAVPVTKVKSTSLLIANT